MIVGHQKGAIMDYLGDGSEFGVKTSYIYQFQRKGLGHAVLQAEDWVNSSFVVLLGDSFIEPKSEIVKLIGLHKSVNPLSTIMFFEVSDPTSYGVCKVKEVGDVLVVEKVKEKPSMMEATEFVSKNGRHLAMCGAYVFEPRIFEYLKKTPPGNGGEIHLTDALGL